MLTVMLIDDEYLILKGLETMLRTQTEIPLDVHPFLDAVNAAEALPTAQPDVVITDVCMPELDGLSFIEEMQGRGFEGAFIVISGYEDAAYLKRALHSHVEEYLIKPISKAKLMDALRRVYARKQERRNALVQHLRLALTGTSTVPFVPQDCWRMLWSGPYCALVVLCAEPEDETSTLLEKLSQFYPEPISVRHGQFAFLLCFDRHAADQDSLRHICRQCGADGFLGVCAFQSSADLTERLRAGIPLRLLNEACTDGLLQLLADGQPGFNVSDMSFAFGSAVCSGDQDQALAQFEHLWQESQGDAGNALLRGLIEIFAFQVAQFGRFPPLKDMPAFYRHLCTGAQTRGDVRDALLSWMDRYTAFAASQAAEQKYPGKINQAVRYIHTHFAEDLSLSGVAEQVALSPNYFSSMFRRQVGESFLSYLHHVRMEEACRILQTHPHISIESVSRMVGYQTAGHFYKVFRSTYGKSPQSWRDLQRKGEGEGSH